MRAGILSYDPTLATILASAGTFIPAITTSPEYNDGCTIAGVGVGVGRGKFAKVKLKSFFHALSVGPVNHSKAIVSLAWTPEVTPISSTLSYK
tara:strand:- start:132 stop:410 length:279 start_codon:yes stop_codon:yes gene_type:complete